MHLLCQGRSLLEACEAGKRDLISHVLVDHAPTSAAFCLRKLNVHRSIRICHNHPGMHCEMVLEKGVGGRGCLPVQRLR